jgi:hypothetical protein
MKIEKEVDVLVAGAGAAGIGAAIAAARNGARVLLVERHGFLGGVAALGYCFHTFFSHRGEKVVGGIAEEIIQRLIPLKGAIGHIRWEGGHFGSVTPIDQEMVRFVLNEMVAEAGIEVLLFTLVLEAAMEGERVRGALLANKAGVSFVPARVVIDASGDGDLAQSAGVPFALGREEDGLVQPVSMLFRMIHVDLERAVHSLLETDKPVLRAFKPGGERPSPIYFSGSFAPWQDRIDEEGLFPDRHHKIFCNSVWEDQVNINTARVAGVNPLDPREITRAEFENRRQIFKIASFLNRHVPGFEKAQVIGNPFSGVRESRRIVGEYVLTEEDVLAGRRFEDAVGRSAYPIDLHDPRGKGVDFTQIGGGGFYDIPYRCLVPKGRENLLVAGRCLSSTHLALGSVRSITSCFVTGEAAGTAAALSIQDRVSVRDVSLSKLQKRLREMGAIV